MVADCENKQGTRSSASIRLGWILRIVSRRKHVIDARVDVRLHRRLEAGVAPLCGVRRIARRCVSAPAIVP